MNIIPWIKKIRKLFNSSSLILMYHKVADPVIDPWQLAVSPANFDQQLQILKDSGLVVSMSYLAEQLYSQKKSSPSIVITFDDGYQDNYLNAKPLLEKYNLPATFFICTNNIGKAREFWWDELADIVLLTKKLPPYIALPINNISFTFDLKEEQDLTEAIKKKHKGWNCYDAPVSHRSHLYFKLWQLLSPLPYEEQQHVLFELKQSVGILEHLNDKSYSMTADQLVSIAKGNLISIGCHTVSHPLLSLHSKEVQNKEISQSKYFLETLTEQKINSFAYPSGNFNATTVEILKQQGFEVACTTNAASVKPKDDPFRLSRFQVNNWKGIEFKRILSNWF